MKKMYALVACLAAFACGCDQKPAEKKVEDQNYEDRRKNMQQNSQKPCGSCEAEKSEKVEKVVEAPKVESVKVETKKESATVSTPEVKVEKSQ